jgi:hypothetical protein
MINTSEKIHEGYWLTIRVKLEFKKKKKGTDLCFETAAALGALDYNQISNDTAALS